MEHFGHLLAQALVYNIGGNAARSELDKLADPLKKIVVAQARSKKWLEAALLGEGFPSQNVSEKEKMVFLQKITKYAKSTITIYPQPRWPFLLLTLTLQSSWSESNQPSCTGLLVSLSRHEFHVRILKNCLLKPNDDDDDDDDNMIAIEWTWEVGHVEFSSK